MQAICGMQADSVIFRPANANVDCTQQHVHALLLFANLLTVRVVRRSGPWPAPGLQAHAPTWLHIKLCTCMCSSRHLSHTHIHLFCPCPTELQTQSMQAIMYVPSALVSTHIGVLGDMEPCTSMPVQLQLVLLPRHAADVTPDTPAQGVIELRHDVAVRKGKVNQKTGSCSYIISGLPLTHSQPARDGWFVRGEAWAFPGCNRHSDMKKMRGSSSTSQC